MNVTPKSPETDGDKNNIILENITDSISKSPIPISITITKLERDRKYDDHMPQSPHLNPPQEHGYNNDDSCDDEMDDDDDKSISMSISNTVPMDMDEMPSLDLDSKPMNYLGDDIENEYGRFRTRRAAVIPKEIRVLNRSLSINSNGSIPRARRSRSYAFATPDEMSIIMLVVS